jgi:hypothetical protein
MKKKAYILSFDRDDNLDYVTIHHKITNLSSVTNWAHYLRSSYVLIANNSVHALQYEITKIMPNKQFLLIEVNLKNLQGWLPKEAWEWFATQSYFTQTN